MWIVCITSVRHVLTVNGYGGRQTKENEKSQCFKGWETLDDKFNYGREELVAELISALSGVYLGISVTVREENAAYLKSWCKAIKEEPKFLFTVLADAIKGSKFIAQHLNIRLDVEEVEEEKNTKVA